MMKTMFETAALLLALAASAAAQAAGPAQAPAGEVGRKVAAVAQAKSPAGSVQPFRVQLSDDQLIVLIIGLDGEQERGASLGARRGWMKVVDHGVTTTLELAPAPKPYAAVEYSMDVDQYGLAVLSGRLVGQARCPQPACRVAVPDPGADAARIINAFMDFWANAPRRRCPGARIERCFPVELPL